MSQEARKAPPTPLEKEYQKIEGEYRRDVAIVEARPFLERALFFIWALGDVVLIGVFLLVVPLYLVSGSFLDSRMMSGIVANLGATHVVTSSLAPEALSLGTARVIVSGGTNDFWTEVKNPNDDWYATFTYTFAYDGGETEAQEGFLLPGVSTKLVALHVSAQNTPRSVRLILSDLAWHRVNRHLVPDTKHWLDEHALFPVSDITYSEDIGFDGVKLGQTDFTITNRTPYAYWEPKFLVTLERNGTVVALSKVTLSEFTQGASQQVNVRWFDRLPVSATITVTPEINYFDDRLYMKPQE